ncbi:hypothetical protein REPUB_Repub02eG0002300 [Reevesia pubescens]
MVGGRESVCVTGAGGFLASWIVKYLLLKGYNVHGTVRNAGDDKNAHLKKLDNASANLQLFETDLLNGEGLCAAITGCTGVFHVASPVPPLDSEINPEVELMEPAVTGTRNVLDACLKTEVKKVVVVSSIGAIALNPNWPKGQVMNEECWSDLEFCKAIKQPYCFSKTAAESEAWEYAKRSGLNIVTICPSIIIGPLLQPTLNSSSLYLLRFLQDGSEAADNGTRAFVDVRDVGEAILMLYEKGEAEGRYLCSSHEMRTKDLVEKLKSKYPFYNYPKSFKEAETELRLSSEKLQNLGWRYRPLEDTLTDTVENYEENGALTKKDLIGDVNSVLEKEEPDIERAVTGITGVQMKEIQDMILHFEELDLQMEKERQQLEGMKNLFFIDQLNLSFHSHDFSSILPLQAMANR